MAKKLTARDKKMMQQGYTHRVEAWIHPPKGDDYPVVAYCMRKPDVSDISQILRKSEVKTDYVVIELK